MESELMEKSDDEITLRELLAYAYAGASLYTDDGELQDSRRAPFIDFLRDSPDDIAAKMRKRGKAALDAAGGERKILSDSARRAEIGRLVERMMSDPRSVALRFGSAVDLTDGSEYVDAILWYRAAEESGCTQSYGQGGTLLDALRALAAEIGGKDVG